MTPYLYIGTAVFGVIGIICFIRLFTLIPVLKTAKQETKMLHAYPEWKQNVMNIVANMEAEVVPIINMNDALYAALQKKYSYIIDERDWKYLDLVIYYFETGRADTMKEALQLVERETQTQRIIEAVNEATDRICRAIHMAANRISAQLNNISSQLTTIAMQQQVQIAQNCRLIEAADLRNALIRKANVTSEQIMTDVSRIRSFFRP